LPDDAAPVKKNGITTDAQTSQSLPLIPGDLRQLDNVLRQITH